MKVKVFQDTLDDKWVEALTTEQDLDQRRVNQIKAYPRRLLVLALDDDTGDNLHYMQDQTNQPGRPPRGRDRPGRGPNDPPTFPRREGKEPILSTL